MDNKQIIDTEPWWFMWPPDEENMYCEDGQVRPLQASDYLLTFGKYSGLTLADVTDEWYLNFLQGVADKNGDWFLNKCLSLKKK
jgi:uncharacterized protein (DUF3820 family)